ncbi:uncharacterized protein [Chelonus insularis]|uniref:uncharacterized protein n=1 Tax=Chelonus insularis TaxID=460826 RepID=UPI0015887B51|nr:uncharacterized protein LOC118074473 [Chelonus insularis]
MIGYIALFMLYQVNAYEIFCPNNDENVARTCYYPAAISSSDQELCCYSVELDYYYCCPLIENRRMINGRKISGIIAALVILFLFIFFLCIICTRCPLHKLVKKIQILITRGNNSMRNDDTGGVSAEDV